MTIQNEIYLHCLPNATHVNLDGTGTSIDPKLFSPLGCGLDRLNQFFFKSVHTIRHNTIFNQTYTETSVNNKTRLIRMRIRTPKNSHMQE